MTDSDLQNLADFQKTTENHSGIKGMFGLALQTARMKFHLVCI